MTIESASATPKASKIDKAANGLAEQADRKISDLAHRAEHAAKRAEGALHDGVEALRSHTRTYVDTAARSLDGARNEVADKVRERPMTGLLAAAGIGLLLGMLIGRRR